MSSHANGHAQTYPDTKGSGLRFGSWAEPRLAYRAARSGFSTAWKLPNRQEEAFMQGGMLILRNATFLLCSKRFRNKRSIPLHALCLRCRFP